MVREHQDDGRGFWVCLIVGQNNVNVKTTREGYLACGHCLRYIVDAQGKRIPYTLADCFNKPS